MPSSNFKAYMRHLWAYRDLLLTITIPLVLSPLVICFEYDPSLIKPMRCAFVLAVMIIYWTTECLPIAITALLPMVCFPLMQIVKASELAPKYMEETSIAFIGSILVVLAFEEVGLHKRFALSVLMIVGVRPRFLLLGFMTASWFLSMWTSNTMTTALLVPIVISVTAELRDAMLKADHQPGEASVTGATTIEMTTLPPNAGSLPPLPYSAVSTTDDSEICDVDNNQAGIDVKASSIAATTTSAANNNSVEARTNRKYENMLLLAVAYAASIGGISTIIGTGPNLIMKTQTELAFKELNCTSPLTFFSWMVFAVPTSSLFIILGWMWLLIIYVGPLYAIGLQPSILERRNDEVRAVVRSLYRALPPMKSRHWIVLSLFIFMILLLVTRQVESDPLIGWELIAKGYVKESTATILVALLVFIIPTSLPKMDPTTGKMQKPKHLITWESTEHNFPFGIILLLGGGIAAAHGCVESGLADILATLLYDLTKDLDNYLTLLVVIIFVVFVTEVMSNTACVSILMPILAQLSAKRHNSPLLLMFPAALSASFAFMLPVATPPNAIVFSAGRGRLKMTEMMAVGFGMNLIGIGVVYLATVTWGNEYFHLFDPPCNQSSSLYY